MLLFIAVFLLEILDGVVFAPGSEAPTVPQVSMLGMERFRILEVKQERPVLVCNVEFLERVDENAPGIYALRDEVADLCRNTLKLSYKMGKIQTSESQWDLPEFQTLDPHDLSCWIAFNFIQDNILKQNMLETDSVMQRLKSQRDILQQNLNYLSAASALESAFKEDSP